MLKRSIVAIFVFLTGFSEIWAETKPVTTGVVVDTSNTDVAWTQHVVQSYLHLQDQQQATLRAVEQARQQSEATARAVEEARQQAEAAAKRDAEALSSRLDRIEQEALTERAREIEALQRSHRFTLITVSALGGVAFFGVLFSAALLFRAMQRRIDAATSQAFGAPFPHGTATPALALGETHLVPANPASQSSARLQSAVERLEQRLREMEETSETPAQTSENGQSKPGHSSAASVADEMAAAEAEKAARLALLLGKGQTLLNLHQPENALVCFDEAIALDANDAEGFVKKGSALEQLGRLDEAIECYDRAIAIDHSMTMAYLSKGGVFNRLERYNEALECYEQALRAEKKASLA